MFKKKEQDNKARNITLGSLGVGSTALGTAYLLSKNNNSSSNNVSTKETSIKANNKLLNNLKERSKREKSKTPFNYQIPQDPWESPVEISKGKIKSNVEITKPQLSLPEAKAENVKNIKGDKNNKSKSKYALDSIEVKNTDKIKPEYAIKQPQTTSITSKDLTYSNKSQYIKQLQKEKKSEKEKSIERLGRKLTKNSNKQKPLYTLTETNNGKTRSIFVNGKIVKKHFPQTPDSEIATRKQILPAGSKSDELKFDLKYPKGKKGLKAKPRETLNAFIPEQGLYGGLNAPKTSRRAFLSKGKDVAEKVTKGVVGAGVAGYVSKAQLAKETAQATIAKAKGYGRTFVDVKDKEMMARKVYNQAQDINKHMDVFESLGQRKVSRRNILQIPKLFKSNAKRNLDRQANQAVTRTAKDLLLPPKNMTNKKIRLAKAFDADKTPIRYNGKLIAHVTNPVEKTKTAVARVTGLPGRIILGRTPLQQKLAFDKQYQRELAKRVSKSQVIKNVLGAGTAAVSYTGIRSKLNPNAPSLVDQTKQAIINKTTKTIEKVKEKPLNLLSNITTKAYKLLKRK